MPRYRHVVIIKGQTAVTQFSTHRFRTYAPSTSVQLPCPSILVCGQAFSPRACSSAPSIAPWNPFAWLAWLSRAVLRRPLATSHHTPRIPFEAPTSSQANEVVGCRSMFRIPVHSEEGEAAAAAAAAQAAGRDRRIRTEEQILGGGVRMRRYVVGPNMRHTLRRRGSSVALLRLTLRIAASIAQGRRIHARAATKGLEAMGRRAVRHGAAAIATSATKSTSTAASWTVVGRLVYANDSAVKSIPCQVSAGFTGQASMRLASIERKFVLDIVHGCDSILGIRLLGESDKTEATASASISVLDHHL